MSIEGDMMMTTTAIPRTALRALRGWPLFITLSLLFHLLVLLVWHLFSSQPVTLDAAPMAPFAVQIETALPSPAPEASPAQPPRPVPPVAKRSPEPVKPTAHQETAAPPPAKPAEQTAQPHAVVAPDRFDPRDLGTSQRLLDQFRGAEAPVAPMPTPTPGEAPPDDGARSSIESQIRTRFAEHFVYPRMAQTHGWQGEVMLSFRIETDGTISHIHVVHGSGHAILDQAALDSMSAIQHIEFTPGTVLSHVIELRMPVIYHLAQE